MKYLLILPIILATLLLSPIYQPIIAQDSDSTEESTENLPKMTLYYSDKSPYSQLLLEDLMNAKAEEKLDLTFYKVDNKEIANQLLEQIKECDEQQEVLPAAFFEDGCKFGRYDIRTKAFTLAQIPLPQTEDDSEQLSDTTSLDQVVQLKPEEVSDEDTEESADDDKRAETEQLTEPQYTPIGILIMIAAPSLFLYLTYNIIKKLKL